MPLDTGRYFYQNVLTISIDHFKTDTTTDCNWLHQTKAFINFNSVKDGTLIFNDMNN